MMGSTHKRVGAAWGAALSGVLPGILFYTFSLTSLATSVVAAMLVDADSHSSEINQRLIHKNPIIGSVEWAVEKIEQVTRYIIKLILTFGPGYLILKNAGSITAQIYGKLGLISGFNSSRVANVINVVGLGNIVKVIGVLLIIIGLAPDVYLKKLPILGEIYSSTSGLMHSGVKFFKRCLVALVYSGGGAALIYYNYYHLHDNVLYLCGLLLVITGITPHRAFLHTPYAMVLYSFSVGYIGSKIGLSWLGRPFFVGYASHIVSDMLTNSGIPVWYSFSKKEWKKVSLHLMDTGSPWGHKIEVLYTVLCILAVFGIHSLDYLKNGIVRIF